MRRAYLSLGSNMGDRGAYLRAALATLGRGVPTRCSNVFETAPWGGVNQADFWNLVVELPTTLTGPALLALCHEVEAAAGRERLQQWGPRTLDVDIVLLEGEVVTTPALTIPHPHMMQRRFVLAPLQQLRPDLVSDDDVARAEGDVLDLGTLESLD